MGLFLCTLMLDKNYFMTDISKSDTNRIKLFLLIRNTIVFCPLSWGLL